MKSTTFCLIILVSLNSSLYWAWGPTIAHTVYLHTHHGQLWTAHIHLHSGLHGLHPDLLRNELDSKEEQHIKFHWSRHSVLTSILSMVCIDRKNSDFLAIQSSHFMSPVKPKVSILSPFCFWHATPLSFILLGSSPLAPPTPPCW